MQPFSIGPISARLFTVSTTTGNLVSPIVVTTTAPHSFLNGDIVTISAVVGNTAANGTWIATAVGPTTLSLFTAAGAASTGNGAYVSGGVVSAPTQLSLAATDKMTSPANPKVAKIYFATAIGNAKVSLVGLAGMNQSTLAGVIREMNLDAPAGGRADFYNLDGSDNNVFTITDYWVDFLAPTTDTTFVTYWRN